MQETQFRSLINENGLKLFEMTFPGPKPAVIQYKPTQPTIGWSDKKVMLYLEDTLALNQFCREGFFILGRYAGETTHRIRGECKDTASDDDRHKYPNTISQW